MKSTLLLVQHKSNPHYQYQVLSNKNGKVFLKLHDFNPLLAVLKCEGDLAIEYLPAKFKVTREEFEDQFEKIWEIR